MKIMGDCLLEGKGVCVACESGKDMSVGVVLAALQLYFGDDGSLLLPSPGLSSENFGHGTGQLQIPFNFRYGIFTIYIGPDKNSIRMRLQWIIESRPGANPSRAVLKRVNEYLLTSPAFREKSEL